MHLLYSVADFEPVMTMTKHTVQPTNNLSWGRSQMFEPSDDYSDQIAVQFGNKKS